MQHQSPLQTCLCSPVMLVIGSFSLRLALSPAAQRMAKEKEQDEDNPYSSHLNPDEVKVRQRGLAAWPRSGQDGTEGRYLMPVRGTEKQEDYAQSLHFSILVNMN